MLECGEREPMVMAPPSMCDSAVSPCFHGCPAYLHRHFPPQSPPLHPLDLSLRSQQQPSPWDCSAAPQLQLPATVPSRVCMAAARTVWPSSHLGCHRSAVSLSALNVSPLMQTVAPMWGSDPCFSSPTHWGQVQCCQHSHFPPSSFILPSFVWAYILFSAGQVLLSTLSWCSAFTSVSKGVFLMYLWREMYSMSTYSSTILFQVLIFISYVFILSSNLITKSAEGR